MKVGDPNQEQFSGGAPHPSAPLPSVLQQPEFVQQKPDPNQHYGDGPYPSGAQQPVFQPGFTPQQPYGFAPQQPDPNQHYGGEPYPSGPQQPGFIPQQPGGYPDQGYPPQGGHPEHYPGGSYLPPPQSGDYAGLTNYGDGIVKNFGFDDASIRRDFIRKVYAILAVQLSVSFGFVWLCAYHDGTRQYMSEHLEICLIAMTVLLVVIVVMACCESVRRTSPTNFIFLGIFTVAQAFMLGSITSLIEPDTVMLAVGVTAALCLALTAFAFQTRYDFTVCNGFLFVSLILFTIFGIVAIFFPGKTFLLFRALIGVSLFSVYLIYDTQVMMGGNHKHSISPEEYIFAALSIYLDIINIFLELLRILSAAKDK